MFWCSGLECWLLLFCFLEERALVMPHLLCKKHGWSKTHHHQYLTPAELHDSCFGLLALSISLPTSANGPVTAQESKCPAYTSVMWDPGGPYPNLLRPFTATQQPVVRTARAMLECSPHLLNREFKFLSSGLTPSRRGWETSFLLWTYSNSG